MDQIPQDHLLCMNALPFATMGFPYPEERWLELRRFVTLLLARENCDANQFIRFHESFIRCLAYVWLCSSVDNQSFLWAVCMPRAQSRQAADGPFGIVPLEPERNGKRPFLEI
jgi:hypothetical protein